MKKNLFITILLHFIVSVSDAQVLWDAQVVSINNIPTSNLLCSNILTPNITIANNGLNTITNLKIFTRFDNGTPMENTFTSALPSGSRATFSLNSFVITGISSGFTQVLRVYIGEVNGNEDQEHASDTISVGIRVIAPVPGPVSAGFEGTTFPPAGWTVANPNPGSLTWERATLASKTGIASARIFFWNYSTVGQLDFLQSPIVVATGLDTAEIIFFRAYRKYNSSVATFNDTLSVQLSTDCGTSFPVTVWKKGGAELATNPVTTTINYAPAASDWLPDTIKYVLPPATNSFSVSFTGKNAFGQNLYIDDITIQVKKPVVALPVRLIAFDANKQNSVIHIKWKTAEEINTKEFIIERSSDGVNYIPIGTTAASNTATGSTYSWIDNAPSAVNYYRLKMVDLDDKFTYSKVVKVNFDKQEGIQITPNPANTFITVRINNTTSTNTIIQLIDINGRMIKQQQSLLFPGTTQIFIDMGNIPAGMYYVNVKWNEGVNTKTLKLIKQ